MATLREIQRLVSAEIYKRGEAYYQSGHVKKIKYSQEESSYCASVWGEEEYEVGITINDESGGVEDASCECLAFHLYNGYCKHIVAVLLSLYYAEQRGITPEQSLLNSQDNSIFLQEIMDRYQQLNVEDNDAGLQPLSVEYQLEFQPAWYRGWMVFNVQLKIGPQRRYVVKDVKEFLRAYTDKVTLPFTKTFTYDPEIFHFWPQDKRMLHFLSAVADNERVYRSMSNPWQTDTRRKDPRSLLIPPEKVGEFLDLLPAGQFVLMDQEKEVTEMPLIEDESPFSFTLSKQGHRFALATSFSQSEPTLLSEDGYCYYGGAIYRLNPLQQKLVLPLYQELQGIQNQQLSIQPEQMDTFASTLLPFMKDEGNLKLDRHVAEQIIQPDLVAEVRLDLIIKDGEERLTARVKYAYGNTVVDPFVQEGKREDDPILIRDLATEKKIMTLFEEAGFHYHRKELYLEGEEELYRFIQEQLPQLQQLAEIYTTNSSERMITPRATPPTHLELDEGTNWLEISFELPDVDETELKDFLQAIVEKKSYLRLTDGSFLSLQNREMDSLRMVLMEEDSLHRHIDGETLRMPALRAMQLDTLLEGSTEQVKLGQRLKRLLRNMRDPENLDFPVPGGLDETLRDYQRFGFHWMKTLAHYGFGGILADDMGLGKTIQALTFMLSERDQHDRPALVIAPASLIYNWESECHRFAPELKTVVVAGAQEERQACLAQLTGVDVLITSYPLLRRDIEAYQPFEFRTLILDEAQALKNSRSQTAQAVKALRAQICFALTGTPIENNLNELHSIFDVTLPGLFSNRQQFQKLSPETVARRVRPFILRRMKGQVLRELPEKMETIQISELTPDQKKLYLATLERIQKETRQAIQENSFNKHRMKILAGLTRLRQICCHPALYVENYTSDSGKSEQLYELLEELLANNRRVLIFSQFTSMLAIIREELELSEIPYHYLDGRTPVKERLEMANQFNAGEKEIFLISLKAGGTGLNLTGADTVILYDLWWNPAVEQQAADRAHRIGQKKAVQVIKLIAKGTIEEKIHELQQKKKALIDQVIQPGEQLLSSLGEEDIREILSLT
ncbi:Superfamily II DNA or RNA helicase, SNF2 family [Marininema mesophilum]|uniref:Superfamily II DNA or RNA helicase, SNF2 family n=1 Tax=Marininema mesophilum TaxID=1048340 RepID=A0A1H2ZW77_9BACL|nr:DEAD/DEAH box helicase [Marininema mesophilum]SDX21635.1 Superfamily II DNA or RNA helicase, SNF2 family [Marininema mesophilum]